MLKTTELKALNNRLKEIIPQITHDFIVVDDNDFAKKRKDGVSHNDEEVFIVAVVPSSSLRGKTHDSLRYNNSLIIFVLQTWDENAGMDEEHRQIDVCATIARQIVKQCNIWYGTRDCPVKGLDSIGATIDPVRNYHDTIGYSINLMVRNNA